MSGKKINKLSLFIGFLCFLFIHIPHVHSRNFNEGYRQSGNHIYPGNNQVITGSNGNNYKVVDTQFERRMDVIEDKHEKLDKRFQRLEKDFNDFKTTIPKISTLEQKLKTLSERVDNGQNYYNGRINALENSLRDVTKEVVELKRVIGVKPTESCCAKHSQSINLIQERVANAETNIISTYDRINGQDKRIADSRNELNKFQSLDLNAIQNLVPQVRNLSYMNHQQILRNNYVFQGLTNVSSKVLENSRKIQDLSGISRSLREIGGKLESLDRNVQENSAKIEKNSKNVRANELKIEKSSNMIRELFSKDEEKSEKLKDHSKKIDGLVGMVRENSGKIRRNEENVAVNSGKILAVLGQVQENSKKVQKLKEEITNGIVGSGMIQEISKKFQELNKTVNENSNFVKENSKQIGKNSKNIQETIAKSIENINKNQENLEKIELNNKKIHKHSTDMKNVLDNQIETSGKVAANSQKIDQNSRKADENSKNNQENLKKIVDNNERLKANAENILNSNKAIQQNLKKIGENSAEIRKNSEKVQEANSTIVTHSKKLEGIYEDVQSDSKRIDANSASIKGNQEKLKIESQNIKNVNEKLAEHLEKEQRDQQVILNQQRIIDGINGKIIAAQSKPPSQTPPNISPSTNWDPEVTTEVQSSPLKWTIHKIKEKLKDPSMNLESPYFKLPGYPVEAKAKLFFKPSTSDIHVALSFKNPGKPLSQFYPFPQVTYVLKDQRGGVEARDRATSHTLALNSDELAFNQDVLEEFLVFKPRLLSSHSHFIKDDSIVLEVHVETPSMARLSQTQNGTLVSQVDHFEERRKLAGKYLVGWTSSPYFYTHPNGYRVQLQLWMSMDKRIAPFINFLTTDHDKNLTTNFPHKTTLTIFNPKDFTNNLVLSKETDLKDGTQYDLPQITYDEIKNYVVNDNFYYQLEIQPLK